VEVVAVKQAELLNPRELPTLDTKQFQFLPAIPRKSHALGELDRSSSPSIEVQSKENNIC
jgi:hypothetical protein